MNEGSQLNKESGVSNERGQYRLMAKEEKSRFQISSLILSSFISNIYTPEKGCYWQNQPNSLKVKGYQEVNSNVKQLLH